MSEGKSLPESDISEWKSSWRDDYMKWLAAYAYNDGGKLYIGVNDDGYVVGLKDVKELQEHIPNTIRNKLLISPRVSLRFVNERGTNIRYDVVPDHVAAKDINQYVCGTYHPVTDKDREKLRIWERENPVFQDPDGRYYYLEIEVDHYPNLVTYNGVAYTRSGSVLQVLEGQELERAVLKSTGLTWDSFEAGAFTQDDLDPAAFDYFRKKAIEKKRLTSSNASVSDEKLLGKLELLTDKHKLSRAAVMLFGNPESVATGAYIKIGYFAPAGKYGENTINDVIYHDDIRGPLMLQAEKAIDCLYTKYLKALISYEGIQRIETYMIPEDAMREIILNAIAHKNYPSGNPIQIKVYDDHITVMNEGFWPFDYIRVEDVYSEDHESYPNNPKIAGTLYKAGEIEAWGSGFDKIKKSCTEYGTPLPDIKATKGNVTVRIHPADSYLKVLNRVSRGAGSVTSEGVSEGAGEGVSEGASLFERVVAFCNEPRTMKEIQVFCGFASERYVRQHIIQPLVGQERLYRTIPDKPTSPNQKYYSQRME